MSSKEAKESRHRPEALRQPQRKDSLSSVLSWAGLQTKPGSPRSAGYSSTSSQQLQSSPGTGLKSRRHSHGTDVKKKARNDSTTSRSFSFSNIGGTQEGVSAKTRHTKTLSTVELKTTNGTSSGTKTNKTSSTDKINKQTQDSLESHTEKSQQKQQISSTTRARSTSVPDPPTSPRIVPKSILRVSSPDGHRPPPRRIIAYPAPTQATENGQPNSTEQPPLSPLQPTLPGITEDSAPGSPPASPISRPLSPGATVRFAKATIHRVEVGPGRRFAPVKRKSKSTITYIAPLDPGSQKSTPRGMLTSPTKLRRHVENQKAMGRYWMRTEEEEAQWRAEAAMRAAEEAERYRAEPASPLGPSVLANSPAFHGFSWADGLDALDKLPPVDNLPALDKLETDEVVDKLETEEAVDKLETVVSDSDESDTDAPESGVSILPEEHKKVAEGEKLLSEKPEPQKPGDKGVTTVSASTIAKLEATTQEVKNTTVTKPSQEAKITTSRPPTGQQTPLSTTVSTPATLQNTAAAAAAAKRLTNPPPAQNTVAEKPVQKTVIAAIEVKKEPTTETVTKTTTDQKSATRTESSIPNTVRTAPLPPATEKPPKPSPSTPPSPPSATAKTYSPQPSPTIPITTPPTPPPPTLLSRPTSPTPGRPSSNHLHLSGRRGRRLFDDHESGKHEITA